jgi:hypothetical protein
VLDDLDVQIVEQLVPRLELRSHDDRLPIDDLAGVEADRGELVAFDLDPDDLTSDDAYPHGRELFVLPGGRLGRGVQEENDVGALAAVGTLDPEPAVVIAPDRFDRAAGALRGLPASMTTTERRARTSVRAAPRPDRPPPTMTTSTGSCDGVEGLRVKVSFMHPSCGRPLEVHQETCDIRKPLYVPRSRFTGSVLGSSRRARTASPSRLSGGGTGHTGLS